MIEIEETDLDPGEVEIYIRHRPMMPGSEREKIHTLHFHRLRTSSPDDVKILVDQDWNLQSLRDDRVSTRPDLYLKMMVDRVLMVPDDDGVTHHLYVKNLEKEEADGQASE